MGTEEEILQKTYLQSCWCGVGFLGVFFFLLLFVLLIFTGGYLLLLLLF